MSIFSNPLGLYTDFYELSMAQGYYFSGKKNNSVVFDYFFRSNPFSSGFTVFAGLSDFLDILNNFTFNNSDIGYLKQFDFNAEFLDYLKDFKFNGKIYSVKEGEIVFPNEPIVRVEGNIIECQVIESSLLNILNFESLIATKSFRIKLATGNRAFTDFGLRRAQGFGALHGSRAAIIGGASSTSNVLAGKLFNISVSGTMAHSWIQSFSSEYEAFKTFAEINPSNVIFLVDTYDTLKLGIPNAIKVALELADKGIELKGIRLDSGDLAYLSKKARKMLDAAGLTNAKIYASNQLNEHVIKNLLNEQNAPIDAFGVGTELITGKTDAALDGVYKLAEINGSPKMKFSENIEKTTLPGKKEVVRYFDNEGNFFRDGIIFCNEKISEVEKIYHRIYPEKNTIVKHLKLEKLIQLVYSENKIKTEQKTPAEIHEYVVKRAKLLPDEHKRFISPHLYKVGISKELMETRNALTKKLKTLH